MTPLEPRSAHQGLGPGVEFDTIRDLVTRWGSLAIDIGDDAAVLQPTPGRALVVSTDACIEDVHFRRPWLTPREIGARAAAGALSDLAAMGARAEAVLVAFVVPGSWRPALGEVADGIADVVRPTGARIVGGNLSGGNAFGITTTVIGSAGRAVARSGARPGDVVVVTGRLGGPGAALAAFLSGAEPTAWARGRFAAPVPRVAGGAWLAEHGATAMIDLSDGLVGDARHLAAASAVAIELDAERIPLGPGVSPAVALSSGEEYELLATVPAAHVQALCAAFEAAHGLPLTPIGRVGVGPAGHVIVHGLAPRVEIVPGHDHFSG